MEGLTFTSAQVDTGPGGTLAQAMREEIAAICAGLDLEGDNMPRAGQADLSPPGGTFIVGHLDGVLACCGGIKRLDAERCELRELYVVSDFRGRGVARALLHELERRARALGDTAACLDTGPKQVGALGLFESEGYAEVEDFNGNPAAAFWGQKPL